MVYVVYAPGSCGEFIQGYSKGRSFMVTCPIERYARAEARVGAQRVKLPEKAELARRLALERVQSGRDIAVTLASHIPVGKGLASSTADISAVAQAAALAAGRKLTAEEIASIAIAIEPSDATFYQGIVQFDYRNGRLLRPLGAAPHAKILIYDCGGEVDTLAFNARKDLIALQQKNESLMEDAMALFEEGLAGGNLTLMGEAATISAFANQKILKKPVLPAFYEAQKDAGGCGVIAAHSGTVLGVLLPEDAEEGPVRHAIEGELGGAVSFLDCAPLTNEGMIIEEIK